MKKLIMIAAASTVFATPAMAEPGNTDQATGRATAEVVAPITIIHDTGAVLNFGTFTAGTAAGSVTVTQGGVPSATGDAVHVATSTSSADSFTVYGDGGRSFDIVAAGGSVSEAGGASMTFTTDAPGTGTIGAGGSTGFSVGGTLSVNANQAPGVYVGSYVVTATYN